MSGRERKAPPGHLSPETSPGWAPMRHGHLPTRPDIPVAAHHIYQERRTMGGLEPDLVAPWPLDGQP